MIRSEILKEIAPILRDQLVVCNIGIPSQELQSMISRPISICWAPWVWRRRLALGWHFRKQACHRDRW